MCTQICMHMKMSKYMTGFKYLFPVLFYSLGCLLACLPHNRNGRVLGTRSDKVIVVVAIAAH